MDESKIDIDGKESSKRKLGIKLLNVGIAMAILYYLIGLGLSLFDKELGYEFPLDIWWTFMGTGSGLLGITLVERFSTKK